MGFTGDDAISQEGEGGVGRYSNAEGGGRGVARTGNLLELLGSVHEGRDDSSPDCAHQVISLLYEKRERKRERGTHQSFHPRGG